MFRKLTRSVALLVALSTFVLLSGILGIQKCISSQITSEVERKMPKATGISTSVPFGDVLSNLTSDSIKSVNIYIDSFALEQNSAKTSLAISASKISKAKPNLVGSLDVTATIPASSLPADLQNRIKSKSQRSLTPPHGLKVESVSLSSKGLSIRMSGTNIQLGNLGFSL